MLTEYWFGEPEMCILQCFHDIYAHEYDRQNGGVVRTWQEVVQSTTDKKHKVFSKYPDQWMGIGVVEQ